MKQVDVYHCRDLDSRFSAREVAAVDEFLSSGLPLHSMRDHPAHWAPMVGASWGTHLNRRGARGKWKKAWVKMLQDKYAWADRSDKGPDQMILKALWVTFDWEGCAMTVSCNSVISYTYYTFHF